jgi:hypothetical protein
VQGNCRWKSEEASQVGERANESRGETLLYFAESSRGEQTEEIFGIYFTKFRESLDLPEVQGSYSIGVERIQSSGGASPLIQVDQIHWIVHEIMYRDLVTKDSRIWHEDHEVVGSKILTVGGQVAPRISGAHKWKG